MSKIVAIDLGSNTFRAIVYDCNLNKTVASYEKTVRLAHNLSKTGYICHEALDRVVEAYNAMPPSFKNYPTKAFTTQALRLAKNNNDILQQIKQRTNLEFQIIDGVTEGTLTAKAVKYRLKKLHLQSDSFVVVDIGGGSTEVIFCNDENIEVKSFSIGIVTATEKGLQSLKDEFEKVKEFCKNKRYKSFISTAGTPTTVAAIKHGLTYATYDAVLINATVLTLSDLDNALNKLLNSNLAQRQKLVGILRDDLIITGIEIYKKFYNLLQMSESIAIDDGLREGIALQTCQER